MPTRLSFTAAFDVPDTGRSFMRTNLNKVISQNEVPVFDSTSHRLAACLQCNGRFVGTKPFGGHDKYGSEIFSDAPSKSRTTNPGSTYTSSRDRISLRHTPLVWINRHGLMTSVTTELQGG